MLFFQFTPIFRQNDNWHAAFLIGLVACMSFQGIANIKQQRSIIGITTKLDFNFIIVTNESKYCKYSKSRLMCHFGPDQKCEHKPNAKNDPMKFTH